MFFLVVFRWCVWFGEGSGDQRRISKRGYDIGVAAEDPGIEGCVEMRRFGDWGMGGVRSILTPQGL